MKVGTWKECYTSDSDWEEENLAAKELINLLNAADPEDCMLNLVEFDNLAALTIDQSTDELEIMHHNSKVGKSLLKSKKPVKVVALCGMSSSAQIVRFKSVESLFNQKSCVTMDAPSSTNLETFENPADFKKLKAEKGNAVAFRNIVLLPPFVLKAILAISSRDASNLACSISAASQDFSDQCKSHPDFSVDDHEWATLCTLQWLCCSQKGSLAAISTRLKSDDQIDFWSTNLHEKCLL